MIQQSDWSSTLIILIYIFCWTALFTCRNRQYSSQCHYSSTCWLSFLYQDIWEWENVWKYLTVWSNLVLFFSCLTYVREAAQRAATKSELHKTQIESLLGEKVDSLVWTMLGSCWVLGRRGHCFNKIPCQASSVHFMICQEFSGNWQPWNGEQVVILHRQVYQN